MTEQAVTIIVAVISALGGGGIAAAVVTWLINRGKPKLDIQGYWHREFARLEGRVVDLEKEVKGRDLSIAELKKENADLKNDYAKATDEIKRLRQRIRELERIIRKYDIEPCEDADG